MKRRWPGKRVAGYCAVIAACFAIATISGWTFAGQVDSNMYDWMFRRNPPVASSTGSIVLAIDDPALNAMGGMRRIRSILADALEGLARSHPKLVAIDLNLADAGDPTEDERLETAFSHEPNLILATDIASGAWSNPEPRFRKWAVAEGHAFADQESQDGVTRQIPLEYALHRERHWALALEAFRVWAGSPNILESPEDLEIAGTRIPAKRADHRLLRVRYLRDGIERISFLTLRDHPELWSRFAGKAVFAGVYSYTGARDRVVTPLGDERAPGVAVHAQLFETLRRSDFWVDASDLSVLLVCAATAVLAGLIFRFFWGWPAYCLGAALLAGVNCLPFLAYRQRIVFPFFAPLTSAWLTVAGAAIYQHFVVRRELERSEGERSRYRQAIHFVTHEMKTPLTAIQGSSELIGRYNLNDEKRKQIAQMINSESKRLARMIQAFLDIERLSDGQMELRREPFPLRDAVGVCLERARPLAERKSIQVRLDGEIEGEVRGDRELVEYAVYNLLTNAIKYSTSGTKVAVACRCQGAEARLSIQDQGMGMDQKELKRIFQKFYRTKRAEASGEAGSGIGLSIVDQVVQAHGGRMEVVSSPGAGSCFTVVLPVLARDRKASPSAASSPVSS